MSSTNVALSCTSSPHQKRNKSIFQHGCYYSNEKNVGVVAKGLGFRVYSNAIIDLVDVEIHNILPTFQHTHHKLIAKRIHVSK
jgi:hypothetical protein